jgi:hypothetical protein
MTVDIPPTELLQQYFVASSTVLRSSSVQGLCLSSEFGQLCVLVVQR